MNSTHTDEVLVVTGAGSGIGRAVAHALAPRPETLVLVGRRRSALDQTAYGLDTASSPLLVDADLATPEGAEQLASALGDRRVACAQTCAVSGTRSSSARSEAASP